jgi:hypothetical protein
MKRLVLSIAVCGALSAASASSSLGFSGAFDYVGTAKDQPVSFVGFFLDHPAGAPKRVTGFTVTQVPYECSDAPPGFTTGWRFKPKMRVKSRKFDGKGDWVGLPLDPVGAVSGKLRRSGAVVGEFKLRGELAGPGTHCRTGKLGWKAMPAT